MMFYLFNFCGFIIMYFLWWRSIHNDLIEVVATPPSDETGVLHESKQNATFQSKKLLNMGGRCLFSWIELEYLHVTYTSAGRVDLTLLGKCNSEEHKELPIMCTNSPVRETDCTGMSKTHLWFFDAFTRMTNYNYVYTYSFYSLHI